ncbi:hypothetical protein HanXRQr2_Chr15g0679141 [Helianthus annuus]|uniref:60S ribosomal export protein NMD3 OB-fold domain-containing protein n=1 Tax=Helianthus annuus TaxID=4232 RepID=A0A9K3DZS3_HELAN|nr:hypothetical protein HanXRQr2_Chr15g0679141 [Helianthus annuus]KAJ0472014.1 putative ribosomal export protein Nmd3 [Helianthus annuus]KAJ0651485.1 putative ribosomal export protein Nmd3 [Helianthus annuus]
MEYVVLDVNLVSSKVHVGGSEYVMADAQVACVTNFEKNDTMFNVRTHLGYLLCSWLRFACN